MTTTTNTNDVANDDGSVTRTTLTTTTQIFTADQYAKMKQDMQDQITALQSKIGGMVE